MRKKKEKDTLLEGYSGNIYLSKINLRKRIMVGIPMTGLLRSEWVLSRYGQVIPCNWSQVDCLQWVDQFTPLGFLVADARNVITQKFVEGDFEWLLFIDHDVVLNRDFVLKANDRMLKAEIPVWSGLYFTKSVPSEPLIYRGRGTSYYTNWKMGDEVWVDGIPMGCTMIHNSIMKVLWENSEWYSMGNTRVKRVFETPAKCFLDPETQNWYTSAGTEDLAWCDRVMDEGVLKKAGWTDIAKRKYPFMVDTSCFCRHIDWNGMMYPSIGEEKYFEKKKRSKAGLQK